MDHSESKGHKSGARPKETEKTTRTTTRQQATGNVKSSSGQSNKSHETTKTVTFNTNDASKSVKNLVSTPNKQEDSAGSKRELSSPFDESDLNPSKKNRIPELSQDTSLIAGSGSGELVEHHMNITSEILMEEREEIPTPTFHLADSDLQKIAAIVQMAIQGQVRDMVREIIQGTTEPLKAEVSDLKVKVEGLEKEKSELNQKIDKLIEKVNTLEVDRDTSEQYSRRNSIRISGIPVSDREDTDEIVLNLAEEINCNIKLSDIDRSHRIGKMRKDNTKDLIVKFATYRARDRFMRARTNLKNNEKFKKTFINEDLTKSRSELLFKARKMQKDDRSPVNQVWSWDGRIFVKDNTNGCHLISNEADLSQF